MNDLSKTVQQCITSLRFLMNSVEELEELKLLVEHDHGSMERYHSLIDRVEVTRSLLDSLVLLSFKKFNFELVDCLQLDEAINCVVIYGPTSNKASISDYHFGAIIELRRLLVLIRAEYEQPHADLETVTPEFRVEGLKSGEPLTANVILERFAIGKSCLSKKATGDDRIKVNGVYVYKWTFVSTIADDRDKHLEKQATMKGNVSD